MIFGLDVWIFFTAFVIALTTILILLSLPSIIYMIKIGRKDYFNNWKILFKIKDGLNDCYLIEENQQYNYKYPNGQVNTVHQITKKYYYPIYKENGDVYIIQKSSGPFATLWVIFNTKIGSSWVENSWELKTSSCPFQQLVLDRISKKLENMVHNSDLCEDVNQLEGIIYSDLISKQRESKLEKLLK